MDAKQDIANLPRTLREALEKGRPEYEALFRRIRWGEGPIYLLASGTSWYASLTGVCAFETLPGWPALARSPAVFAAYSMSVLKRGSVVIAISPSGETPAILEVGRASKTRGASLLALTSKPESTLAKMADGVLRLRTESHGSGATVCEQAAMSYLGLVAARIFKKPQPHLEVLEDEFRRLPEQIDWALTQMSDAVCSCASELVASRRICVLGCGFYHPSALQAEHLFRRLGSDARAFDPLELGDHSLNPLDGESALLMVSGSRCRAKRDLHAVVKRLSRLGVKILSITDGNDRELTELSRLAVLLPNLTEMVGAVLASVLIHWVAYQMGRHLGRAG